ncbi:hypothetical protein KIN20_025714 [Parelaphostrongylus tenuis]|uniref:Uncharacterized protein n=1 Tax=Parelaphostrongylus tenuis TaxID=148309 RepID=A0AAD5N9M6_PARTN|nr:hypothetical protein KIN20_024597 [Parelaphostrongylus tenuis]KAJ1365422.1 hypothetical protein KIN20_025714 [Parelaphostrongylus tenuis]
MSAKRYRRRSTKDIGAMVECLHGSSMRKMLCSVIPYSENNPWDLSQKEQIRDLNQPSLLWRQRYLPEKKREVVEERMKRVEENRKYAQMIDRHSRIYFP